MCAPVLRRPAPGHDDASQVLAGITATGGTFPLGRNRMSDEEFAGACFSPGGGALPANVQAPDTTYAVWVRW